MTYLSDKNKQNNTLFEAWKPLDPASLQHIEKQSFIKTDRTEPDYALFKRIYEDIEHNVNKDLFKPLYEPGNGHDKEGIDGEYGFKGFFSEHDFKKSTIFHGGNDAVSELNSYAGENNNTGADGAGNTDDPDKGYGTNNTDDANSVAHPVINDDFSAGISVEPVPDSELRQNKGNGFKGGLDNELKEAFEQSRKEGFNEGRIQGEKQGYAEGYKKGENDARKDCEAKSLDTLSSLEDILLKTNTAWTELVQKYEKEILSLICKIAEKVVLAKVKIDDSLVKDSIFYAMEKLPEPEEVILHVSNDDYEYIEMIKEEFFEKIKGLTSVSVVSDPSINRGGCRIDSSKAKIETDIKSRLDAVFSSIVKAGTL